MLVSPSDRQLIVEQVINLTGLEDSFAEEIVDLLFAVMTRLHAVTRGAPLKGCAS